MKFCGRSLITCFHMRSRFSFVRNRVFEENLSVVHCNHQSRSGVQRMFICAQYFYDSLHALCLYFLAFKPLHNLHNDNNADIHLVAVLFSRGCTKRALIKLRDIHDLRKNRFMKFHSSEKNIGSHSRRYSSILRQRHKPNKHSTDPTWLLSMSIARSMINFTATRCPKS